MDQQIINQFDELVLEKFKARAASQYPEAFLRAAIIKSVQGDSLIEHAAHDLTTILEITVLGRESRSIEATERVPDGWLEAFKEEYFPRFLKARFPVRYRTIYTLTKIFHTCPHLKDSIPQKHYNFLRDPGHIDLAGRAGS
jgi:hypothetical protein